MTDLLVIVPTRGRRARCERLLASFNETATAGTDIVFITDPDDQDTYADMDWGDAAVGVLEPRAYLSGKLNKTAEAMVDTYPVLAWVADDHVFETVSWDQIMLDRLKEMGVCDLCRPVREGLSTEQGCVGHGWVYPEDMRRHDVPEIWMVSSDVVRALGWMANPVLSHFYVDNTVGELGKRSGLIRWCPQAVIRHEHYSITPDVDRDEVYRTTEETFGATDIAAYYEWKATRMGDEVAVLRRQFSPDVAWVLSRVA